MGDPKYQPDRSDQQPQPHHYQQHPEYSAYAPLAPNYYPNPFYHRFIPSPAPFYLTGYTTDHPSGFIEIGAYQDGNVNGPTAPKDLNYAYEHHDNNSIMYDPIYAQQFAAYGGFLASPQNYYENGGQMGYGYTTTASTGAPFIDESGLQHFRLSHQSDLITPYSSELGSNDNLCGGLSSGGTGSSSPAPKTTETSEHNPQSSINSQNSAHVRPLDVITPELFQAIHAPTFYKTVVNAPPPPPNPQNGAFYYPQSYGGEPLSGLASVYGNGIYSSTPNNQNNHNSNQSMYIPPINSLSSMAYQPMKPSIPANYHVASSKSQEFTSTQQKTASNPENRVSYSTGKDLLPTVTGPDGQVYQKPPGSYASIITKALKECDSGKMTLAGIYEWIKNNYPYYRSAEPAWQNSIRHNLSLNKCFKKVPRPTDEPGKGGFWALDYEYIRNQEMSKRMNGTHGLSADLDTWTGDCMDDAKCTQSTEQPSKSTTTQPTKPHNSNTVSSKKRRTAELEASKLLEILIPQEGWEDSVRAVASVVDEIYAANFEHEASKHAAMEVKKTNGNKRNRRAATTSNNTTKSVNAPLLPSILPPLQHHQQHQPQQHRPREPKPYSSMASTLKIPTPILPNALSGTASGSSSASRQLQYHQYQPATPLSSGTSSAK